MNPRYNPETIFRESFSKDTSSDERPHILPAGSRFSRSMLSFASLKPPLLAFFLSAKAIDKKRGRQLTVFLFHLSDIWSG